MSGPNERLLNSVAARLRDRTDDLVDRQRDALRRFPSYDRVPGRRSRALVSAQRRPRARHTRAARPAPRRHRGGRACVRAAPSTPRRARRRRGRGLPCRRQLVAVGPGRGRAAIRARRITLPPLCCSAHRLRSRLGRDPHDRPDPPSGPMVGRRHRAVAVSSSEHRALPARPIPRADRRRPVRHRRPARGLVGTGVRVDPTARSSSPAIGLTLDGQGQTLVSKDTLIWMMHLGGTMTMLVPIANGGR